MNLLKELRLYAPDVDLKLDNCIGTFTEKLWVAKTALKKCTQKTTSTKSGKHGKLRKECIGTNKTTKLLIAYTLGQITQLVLHGMVISLNMWDSKRILFCAAFGFVILFAAIAGTVIAKGQDEKLDREYKEKKTYLDYAQVHGKAGADENKK